jgi:spermidine synthase
VAVALFVCLKFERETSWAPFLKGSSIAVLLLLLVGFVLSEKIMSFSESLSYRDTIIYAKSSPYQRIVLTRNDRELRLFLNGNLQFSSADEYRYHEALVHPGMQGIASPKKVLVLGGGDGLAVREILKYPSVESVTLVDLDGAMTRLFSTNSMLVGLNNRSLLSPKVKIINADAFGWLKEQNDVYDFIAVDFPDPSNYSIGKLYTNSLYKLLYRSLSPDGIVVIQATSPFVAPKSYWCVNTTLQSVGFHTVPFHTYVPSFGDWGYIMALKQNHFRAPATYLPGLRFIDGNAFAQMRTFPKDMAAVPVEVNKLNNQVLVHYFEHEWSAYLQ